MKTVEKIKKLEKEKRAIYNKWHNEYAWSDDDRMKLMIAREEYDKLDRKIKRLKHANCTTSKSNDASKISRKSERKNCS